MIRTLSLVSVLALLPATACGQEPSEEALNAKAAEAEMAIEARAETPQVGLPNGAEAPAVSLVDTAGETQTLETLAGPKGTVFAFVRSADWCPYCKKQLLDLEAAAAPLAAAGWTLVAVSYDPVETLAGYKADKGLTYELLSDEGSAAIKAFNLLNTEVKPGSRYEGIPHPAIVFVNADGHVVKTLREEGYKTRPAVDLVIETAEGL
ncbi:MAG: redoxin domain-containing protein [Hyphomonas oceanitis]|uniref:peroxiredoxin family protein n=1 Tax=Hyphomonas oceanitis TaxID=81033 RepID=UPI003002E556